MLYLQMSTGFRPGKGVCQKSLVLGYTKGHSKTRTALYQGQINHKAD